MGRHLGDGFGVQITCHTGVWTSVYSPRCHTKAKHSNDTCMCDPFALTGSGEVGSLKYGLLYAAVRPVTNKVQVEDQHPALSLDLQMPHP